jgi:hypothetical protein
MWQRANRNARQSLGTIKARILLLVPGVVASFIAWAIGSPPWVPPLVAFGGTVLVIGGVLLFHLTRAPFEDLREANARLARLDAGDEELVAAMDYLASLQLSSFGGRSALEAFESLYKEIAAGQWLHSWSHDLQQALSTGGVIEVRDITYTDRGHAQIGHRAYLSDLGRRVAFKLASTSKGRSSV